jgi:hypothetical protein
MIMDPQEEENNLLFSNNRILDKWINCMKTGVQANPIHIYTNCTRNKPNFPNILGPHLIYTITHFVSIADHAIYSVAPVTMAV